MKKIMSIALIFLFFALCNAGTSKKMSQEVQEFIINMGKDIYVWYPDELSKLIEQSFPPAPTITAAQLKIRMKEEKDLIVINVLSERIHADCHIADSINIPLHKMIQKVLDWDRGKKIVVYCALKECDASEKAYILLSALDFKNVIEYQGGIKEWFKLGYAVVGPCALSYLHEDIKSFVLCPCGQVLKR